MKIKVNDQVKVLSGKEKGRSGKVTQVFPREGKIVVEGINQIKKHLRARSQSEKGQIIALFAPFPASRVMLICPKCQKPTRVGYAILADKKVRQCKSCEQTID